MAGTIKGITVEIGGDTTQLQKALSEVNSKTKDINSELNQVSKLLKLDPSNTTLLAQKQQLLSEAITTSSSKLETLKSVQEQVNQQFQNGDIGESQYRAFERQIESTEISLKKYSDQQNELASGASATGSEVKNLGNSFDDAGNKALSFGDILKADLIANGISALASAAKDTASEVLNLATQTDSASGMIQAQLGLTSQEANNLTEVAKSVWTDGFGDNVSDVTTDLATVRQYLGDMSDNEMQSVLENAYTISDVFGADVNESVKSAKTMMQNFGISSSDAFDLITAGYQNGLDYSGEFLDTLNEYSPQFSSMGLSAQDAMNMLISGADNGAFSLDKVADSMKEFNLRIKDGSTTTSEGLQLLGLDASDISQKLSDGSMTSAQAMQMVITALQNTDDKVTQNLAGVDLFGTQWEDVGSSVVLSLGDVTDSLGDITGATSKAGDAAYDNLGTNFNTALRGIQTAFEPLAEKILNFANSIMPQVTEALQWISDNSETIAVGIAAVGAAFVTWKVTSMVSSLITSIQGMIAPLVATTAATEGATVAQEGLNTAQKANPIGLIITIIAALVTALLTLWNTNEGFRNAIISAWEAIQSVIGTAVTAITNFFTVTIPAAFSSVITWFTSLPGNILQFFDQILTELVTWNTNVMTWIATTIPLLVQSIVTFFSQLPLKIWNAIITVITTLGTWATNVKTWIASNVPLIIAAVVSFFSELPGKIGNAIVDAITVLANWAADLIAMANEKLPEVVSTIVGFFAAIPAKMVEIGANIITGLWDGMQSMISWIWDKVTAFCNSIVAKMQSVLSIGSPSKVMADEVGHWIPAGIAVGISDNASAVTDAMGALDFKLGNLAVAGSVPNSYSNYYNNSYSTSNGGDNVSLSIGDIYLSGVDNTDQFADALVKKLPSAFLQRTYMK